MSKWGIFNSVMIVILTIGVLINVIRLDYINMFINFFLLLGVIFSMISQRIKSTDTYSSISAFSFIIAASGLFAKYFIF